MWNDEEAAALEMHYLKDVLTMGRDAAWEKLGRL